MKKTLLYIPAGTRHSQRLRKAVNSVVEPGDLEVCRDLNCLSEKLLEIKGHESAGVFLIDAPATLESVSARLDPERGLGLIIVLSQWNPVSVRLAHTLRPRLLISVHSDFSEATAVLSRILT